MKTILMILGAVCAVSASAETINLDTSNCGATRHCTTVYTDPVSATLLTINAITGQVYVRVALDGVLYEAPAGNAPGTLNTVVSITELTLVNAETGASIVLNADFYGKRVLHRSGHNYYTTQWVLLSGTVER